MALNAHLQRRYDNNKFAFIVFATLVSIQFWSFQGMPGFIIQGLEVIVITALIFIVINNYKKRVGFTIFERNVWLFMIIPLVSSIGALIFHNQPIYLSIIALRLNLFWLLYFVLHIFNIPPKRIVNLITMIGLVWIFLTVIQQFTYPHYIFYTRDESENSILRAGVYRFMLNGHHYGLFIILYYFYKFLKTKKVSNLALTFFGLLGFYYYGTRQFAIAAVICIIIAIFMQKGNARIFALAILVIGALIMVFVKDALFAGYIELAQANAQSDSDGDIRLLSSQFYLFTYWPHWFATIIGNGFPHSVSSYGIEMTNIKENLGFYRSDVGIIGAFNAFGIFYVINLIWVNIRGLRRKYYSDKNKYLRLFFYYSFMLLIISEYYDQSNSIPFFCFIFYMVEKSFLSDRKAEKKRLEIQNQTDLQSA